MNYSSERLYFREFNENDFELLYSIYSNDRVMKYTYLDKYDRKEELRPYFEEILKNNQEGTKRQAYEFAVFLLDGSFVGMAEIEISIINEYGGIGEIGYYTLPSFWGNGYTTEIAKLLLEIGFRDIKLHRLYGRCNVNNLASKRVMEKIGMKKEGELRKVRFKEMEWVNEFSYGILLEEWK